MKTILQKIIGPFVMRQFFERMNNLKGEQLIFEEKLSGNPT
jgi:hypothetical protein